MSCYMLQVDKKGNHCQYRIPAVGHALYRGTFLRHMNISSANFKRWRSFTLPTRNVLPQRRGLSFDTSNAAKPEAKAAV